MKKLLFFLFFFLFLFILPSPVSAQVCSTDGVINCPDDAFCQKPGGTCATMKCEVTIPGTPKRCVQQAAPTPSPTPTATPAPTSAANPGTPATTAEPTPISCTTHNCSGRWCNGRLSHCLIVSKKGEPLQCGCGVPPPPPSPPCAQADQDKTGLCTSLKTAIGNVSTTPVGLAKTLFGIVLSLSGGIAVILLITAGYQIMTSSGDPEKIQGAKDTITSTIIGLVFIIFSLVVLQIIGIDILRIPGLSR